MKELYIGIDTSNYTSSYAASDENGAPVLNIKKILNVKEGERGLRQSDAVFEHIKNYPSFSDEIRDAVSGNNGIVKAVCYSSSPRMEENSYMPCFLVGKALALTLASTLGVPAFETSHQHGHVLAAVSSAVGDIDKTEEFLSSPFIAFHISGGTSDILLCTPDDKEIIAIKRIGGSLDANCGQIIDRTGVRLGFPFPSGKYLDKCALECTKEIKLTVRSRGKDFNLSGLENQAMKLINDGRSREYVSSYVLSFIGKTIENAVFSLSKDYPSLPIVFAGGVMSSSFLKKTLQPYGMFSSPEYSSDNGMGVALIGLLKNRKK